VLLKDSSRLLYDCIRSKFKELIPEDANMIATWLYLGIEGSSNPSDEYSVSLTKPVIESPKELSFSTDKNSFALSCKAENDAEYIQVTGAFNRKIVLADNEKNFSLILPIPRTGTTNSFSVICCNQTRKSKSESVTVNIEQTATKRTSGENLIEILDQNPHFLSE
jgi:hypothetical protein